MAAELRAEELHVPFGKQQLETAPHHEPGLELSPQDEMDLFDHYGVPYDDPVPRSTPGMTAERAVGGVGRADEARGVLDTSWGVTDDAMTRSEERLRVRIESKPAGRVRLRKQVVTEYQQVTVPVRREEIRLEREPAKGPGPSSGFAWASRPSSSSRPSAGRFAERRSSSTPTPTPTTRADFHQQEMPSPPE